ncbi:MAG: NhaA family Na+:H+ antiporter [Paracoccaceae bacterium]|jgi:NhaA family Na+:H+ antiporter
MPVAAIREFFKLESAGGICLFFAAVVAIILDNSALAPFYDMLLSVPVAVKIGALEIAKPSLLWINDGLMAVFFFLVGLEIKREALEGQLSSVNQIALPGVAAIGGMAVPAAIYAYFNWSNPVDINGWAIPAATDIAFALGILMLLGSRVPLAIKVFLTAVAIIDDLGAIVIIALFYTENLSLTSLAWGVGGLVVCAIMNLRGVTRVAPYILIGIIVWVAVLKSGVHATLAGVLLALAVPLRATDSEGHSPLRHLEHILHPWVAFLVLPVFAFANAGVNFSGMSFSSLLEPLPLGIALGLFVGKQIGVFGATFLMIKTGLAKMPEGANWGMLYGVSLLCGIGFTMSLFVGGLAFDDAAHATAIRLGVLAGSLVSGTLGYFVIKFAIAKVKEPKAA